VISGKLQPDFAVISADRRGDGTCTMWKYQGAPFG
jgi:hypothetical protein